MACVIKIPPASGSSTVRRALMEPLTAGDVYEANTNSVDFWAVNGSKEIGTSALLGLPSLVRRFIRCKSAHEYVRASLIAVPTVPLAAAIAVGGAGSLLLAMALADPPSAAQHRSDEGVWEERLARALDLDTKELTGLATQLSGQELDERLNLERTLFVDVSKCLAEQGKRIRCSGMLQSRLRAWGNQIEQLGRLAKQTAGRRPVCLGTNQNLNKL